MSPETQLQNEVIFLIQDFIKVYNNKGMRASGKWANNLEGEVTPSSGRLRAQIFGLDYSQQLEVGRLPNKVEKGSKQEKSMIAFLAYGSIAQWVKDKNISILAWLIARKIVREGWDRREHGGVGIVKDVFTPRRIQSIINNVGEAYIDSFTTVIIKTLKDGISK